MAASGDFAYPQTDESPSRERAECLVQPPATGLRLPAPGGCDHEELQSSRSDSGAGGERAQVTTGRPQEVNAARREGGSPQAAPTGLVLEGRMDTDPNG